jgi:hypothetical protein
MSEIPNNTKVTMVAEMVEQVLAHKTRVISRTYSVIESVMTEYKFPKDDYTTEYLSFLVEVSDKVAKLHDQKYPNTPEGPDDRIRQRGEEPHHIKIRPLLPNFPPRQPKS